ncbi:MAG: carboxylesterase family protein, partial [Mycobacterium sp.]
SLDYAASVGCGDPAGAAACLRALPATALVEPVYYGKLGDEGLSGPVTDTSLLPQDPVRVMAEGTVAQVPVLIGTNRDDFTLFMALKYLRLNSEPSAADYPELLVKTFGPAHAPAIEQRYPPGDYGGSTSLAYSAAVTDGAFACVADRMGRDLAAAGVPVYAYEFNDRTAPAPDPLRKVPFPVGASHSLELRYLFDMGGTPELDPVQQKLSEQMIDYFTQFIATGVPAAPGAPQWPPLEWPPLGGADAAHMAFDTDGSRVATGFAQEHQCGFWAGLQ